MPLVRRSLMGAPLSCLLASLALSGCLLDGSEREETEALASEAADAADRGAAGALVEVTLASRVGVVLDELPSAQRTAAANYYLAKGNQFWAA